MKVEQLSIFLENKAGRLAEVTQTLKEAGINIRALSLADTSDFGILRLIVDDTAKAEAVLKKGGFTVGRTFVVGVVVDDNPGGLNAILEILSAYDCQRGVYVRLCSERRQQRHADLSFRSYRSGHRSAQKQGNPDHHG